jgi:hypothetical protein
VSRRGDPVAPCLPDGRRTLPLPSAPTRPRPLTGRVDLGNVTLVEADGCFPPRPGASVGNDGDVAVASAPELRAALLNPAVRRIRVTGDIRLGGPGGGSPWGPGAPAAGPGSLLILGRPVEIRACRGPDGAASGVQRYLLDFAGAVGIIVVAGGGALRVSGDLLLLPCASGAPQCAAVWPALPAVALGPGTQLEMEVGAPLQGGGLELGQCAVAAISGA